MKTTEENNRMIAEFMGAVEVRENNFKFPNLVGLPLQIGTIQYHSSWDWLIPVVEKISKTFGEWDYEDERRLKAEEIFYMDNMFSEFLQNDINAVFGRVVQFIEWYNEQK